MVAPALTRPAGLYARIMSSSHLPIDPGPVAVGTWSGGRFMHFGEPIDDERFLRLITPDETIRTVITADVYGTGEADTMLGRALARRRAHPRPDVRRGSGRT